MNSLEKDAINFMEGKYSMSDFNAYQRSAATTAIYTDKVVYPALGLIGEAGEVANKVKKVLRDKEGVFDEGDRDDIAKELGDVLWYIAALATDMQLSLGYIASQNELKLSKRKANGTIGGSGDNR
jgi:NTP pyrophosphatase (non-canonical NTP hydrolase)